MVVSADTYFMMLGMLSPPPAAGGTEQVRTYSWTPYGPFSDQTELLKMLMTGSYIYDELKIIKVDLPLLLRPDHDTVNITELTEDAQCVELKDDKPST